MADLKIQHSRITLTNPEGQRAVLATRRGAQLDWLFPRGEMHSWTRKRLRYVEPFNLAEENNTMKPNTTSQCIYCQGPIPITTTTHKVSFSLADADKMKEQGRGALCLPSLYCKTCGKEEKDLAFIYGWGYGVDMKLQERAHQANAVELSNLDFRHSGDCPLKRHGSKRRSAKKAKKG